MSSHEQFLEMYHYQRKNGITDVILLQMAESAWTRHVGSMAGANKNNPRLSSAGTKIAGAQLSAGSRTGSSSPSFRRRWR